MATLLVPHNPVCCVCYVLLSWG